MKSSRMTTDTISWTRWQIAAGGWIDDHYSDPATQKPFATDISFGSTIFLRLILDDRSSRLLTSVVEDRPHVRCRGGWARRRQGHAVVLESASLVSLALGLFLVDLFQPGLGVHKVVSGVSSASTRTP